MRWSLVDLFAVVLLSAIALGLYRAFWGPEYLNARILLAANLALLAVATVGACQGNFNRRRMCLAYAIFGWSYLVVVLRGGFGYEYDATSSALARFSIIGILVGLGCALVAFLLLGGEPRSRPIDADDAHVSSNSKSK